MDEYKKKDFTHIKNDTIITNKIKMFSNKLRGLYFIVGESQFLSHDFNNILSKSLDLGLNLLGNIGFT